MIFPRREEETLFTKQSMLMRRRQRLMHDLMPRRRRGRFDARARSGATLESVDWRSVGKACLASRKERATFQTTVSKVARDYLERAYQTSVFFNIARITTPHTALLQLLLYALLSFTSTPFVVSRTVGDSQLCVSSTHLFPIQIAIIPSFNLHHSFLPPQLNLYFNFYS